MGGFALTAATAIPGVPVHGVEIAAEAVASAVSTAADLNLDVTFSTGDAVTAAAQADLVVVNPPRRGIGDLTSALEGSRARWVLYSSCNVDSLARDLARMPSYRPLRARLIDMFPQTAHCEVLLLLERHPHV